MPATKRVLGSTADLAALRAQLEVLAKSGAHEQVVDVLLALVEKQQSEIHDLAQRYMAALRQMHRKKSEKISADQLALFLAQLPPGEAARAEVEVEPLPDADEPETEKPKRRGGRKPLPDDLRREIVEVPLCTEERICDGCGKEKNKVWTESQLTLEFKPAELFVIEHRREVRACGPCQQGVATAPPAPKPIEGGRPGPGLLAHIVTSKLHDGLPLYRQSQIFRRSGVEIADSTLGDWFAASAHVAEPLCKQARRQTLVSYLMSLDDTGMPVLDRDHPKGIRRGHIWTFIGDAGRVGFCEFTPDWKGKWPLAILDEFSGEVVQSDGYAGIDPYFARRHPTPKRRAGCMDHCRRKFRDALDAGDVRAAVVVSLMRDLYAVEERARTAGASLDDLAFRRRAHSRPIVDRLHQLIAELHGKVPPKSPLGKATTYAINQWPTLTVFLDDPRVPLSNIHVEQQQRRTALGRKNYLFAGSDEGGRRLAILQTLLVCCDLVDAPPFEYLRDVFAKIADGWPQSRIAELLPAAWLANQRRQQPNGDAVADTASPC